MCVCVCVSECVCVTLCVMFTDRLTPFLSLTRFRGGGLAEAAGLEMKNNKNFDDFYGFFLDNAFAAGLAWFVVPKNTTAKTRKNKRQSWKVADEKEEEEKERRQSSSMRQGTVF